MAFRYRGSAPIERRYGRFVLGTAAIALVHVGLITAWPGSMIKLVGAIVGQPSVWPYVRVMEFSVGPACCVVLATAWGLWGLATASAYPTIGCWRSSACGFRCSASGSSCGTCRRVIQRHRSSRCCCAHSHLHSVAPTARGQAALGAASRPIQHAAVLAVVVIAANPAALSRRRTCRRLAISGSPGRGAIHSHAEHHAGRHRARRGVLQQTYYLGRVDYWLVGRKHAWRYMQRVNGRIQDFYTATAVIDTGEQFRALLDSNPQRRIFVIGSGENSRDGRREMRGQEINELLRSDRFEPLFVGSDNFTTVWLAKPPAKQQAAAH